MIDDRRHISSNPFTLKTILWKMDFYIFSGSDLKCIVALSCPFMLQYNYEKEESFCQVEIYWDSLFARSRSPFQVLARQADEGGGWPFKTHISNSTSALFRLFEPFEAAQGGGKSYRRTHNARGVCPFHQQQYQRLTIPLKVALWLWEFATKWVNNVKIKDICLVFCKCCLIFVSWGRGGLGK